MPEGETKPHHGGNLVPTLILAGLVLAILAGVWVFPRVSAYMARQDCIGSGHVNCGD